MHSRIIWNHMEQQPVAVRIQYSSYGTFVWPFSQRFLRCCTCGVTCASDSLGNRTGIRSLLWMRSGQIPVSAKPFLSCLICRLVRSTTCNKADEGKKMNAKSSLSISSLLPRLVMKAVLENVPFFFPCNSPKDEVKLWFKWWEGAVCNRNIGVGEVEVG